MFAARRCSQDDLLMVCSPLVQAAQEAMGGKGGVGGGGLVETSSHTTRLAGGAGAGAGATGADPREGEWAVGD